MKRMNFRHMLFIGKDDQRQSGFGSRVYIVGARARTMYYAHGACDVKNRRAFPKWLQHGKRVFKTEDAAREYTLRAVTSHLERGYTNLKARQKPLAVFNGKAFEYTRSDGAKAISNTKSRRTLKAI